ncbi:M20/M25/M40 family metallo-hydrolase [Streptomyces sp. NPDC086519]|uniref:M20/M25/M40 family metallo-hydrolase n=1 Tax=Streptomyces sp. NPDC086519 TaxID=3154863 RepID=UPI00344464FA
MPNSTCARGSSPTRKSTGWTSKPTATASSGPGTAASGSRHAVTRHLVDEIRHAACRLATEEGCTAEMTEESFSSTVDFDPRLRDRLTDVLDAAPQLGTGAGHDAGVLKDHVPTAMVFVRNFTGVSHVPADQVEDADAGIGAAALADSLETLLRR